MKREYIHFEACTGEFSLSGLFGVKTERRINHLQTKFSNSDDVIYSTTFHIKRNFGISILVDYYLLHRIQATSILLRSQARCQKKSTLMKFYNSVYLPSRGPMFSEVFVAINSSCPTVYRRCR